MAPTHEIVFVLPYGGSRLGSGMAVSCPGVRTDRVPSKRLRTSSAAEFRYIHNFERSRRKEDDIDQGIRGISSTEEKEACLGTHMRGIPVRARSMRIVYLLLALPIAIVCCVTTMILGVDLGLKTRDSRLVVYLSQRRVISCPTRAEGCEDGRACDDLGVLDLQGQGNTSRCFADSASSLM